jgi:predicted permease
MSFFRKILRRLQYLVHRADRSSALREEMEFHLQKMIAELETTGMSTSDARAAAQRKFGNLTRKSEQSQEVWIARWLGETTQDFTFVARSLRRNIGFTVVAVVSAALGVGTCSAVFAVANFAFFHKLPVEQPARLLAISGSSKSSPGGGDYLSFPKVTDLQRAPGLDNLAAYFPMLAAEVTSAGKTQRTWGTIATSNYFDVARPKFLLGHGFTSTSSGQTGLPPEVVIGHALWVTRFAGDPQIIGKTIKVNGFPVTVVGVTDIRFRGTQPELQSEFWVPFSMIDDFPSLPMNARSFTDRDAQIVRAIAGLRDGYSLTQAQTELNAIAKTLQTDYPEANKERGFHIEAAGQLDPAIRPLLAVFFSLIMGIAILVLVASCVNVANLLLARASTRQQEIATRLALGSSRGRLLRLLLAESVVLAGVGGVCGILMAYFATSTVGKFRLPVSLPINLTVTLDAHLVFFSGLLSVITGLGFGFVPAIRAAGTSLVEAIKDNSDGKSKLRRFTLRNILVVVQVSVSMMLLICSGLFVRSLVSSRTANTGFSNRDVLLLSVDPDIGDSGSTQMRSILRALVQRAHEMPGIESASLTDSMPLSFGGNHSGFIPNGMNADQPANAVFADIYSVAPDFFNTLGIPLLQGQDFGGPADQNSTPVIINEAFAQRAFPHEYPIGRKLKLLFNNKKQLQVVGVVANSMSRTISSKISLCVYLPLLDGYEAKSGSNLLGITLLLKTEGDPGSYITPVREMLHSSFAGIALLNFETLQAHLDEALILPRIAALIFGACGCMGLVLSAIGIFGVVSFNVARRTKEIGVRMAMGARQAQILVIVVKSGMVLSGIGCLTGLGLALVLTKAVSSVLYGVSPHDLTTFVVAPAIIVLVTLMACLIPSRRAAALNPVEALRYE